MVTQALPNTLSLEAHSLSLAYGDTLALNCGDLQVSGTVLAVIGHNGSGKSTLLKAILGLHAPRTGTLNVIRTDNNLRNNPLVPEKHMAFSPENGAVFEDISVESYIKLWCRLKQRDSLYYLKEGSRFIEIFKISELLGRKGRELSKGQRRRVQTVVGYLTAPTLFLFDEPFDGLDVLQTKSLADIIKQESAAMCVVLSSHRMEVVERLADSIIVLHEGRVFTSGNIQSVCRTLCPKTYLFTIADTAALPRLLKISSTCYPDCRVSKYHEQVSISGRALDPNILLAACAEADLGQVHCTEAAPSLPDAMSFHLSQEAQVAE